jgi:hypothetical protein
MKRDLRHLLQRLESPIALLAAILLDLDHILKR